LGKIIPTIPVISILFKYICTLDTNLISQTLVAIVDISLTKQSLFVLINSRLAISS
jgi:hypothetical protein